MSLFVLSSKDGWVNIMYDGLDAVGIDQQVRGVGTAAVGDLKQIPYVTGVETTVFSGTFHQNLQ
jgi:hypothetical protein